MSLLQDELKASGFAQVIVTLKPAAAGAAAGLGVGSTLRRLSKAVVKAAAGALQKHFTSPDNSQDIALVKAAAGRVLRRVKAGTRTVLAGMAALESVAAEVAAPPKVRVFENLGVLLGTADRAGVAALKADPNVETVSAAPQLRLIRPVERAAAGAAAATGGVTWGLNRLRIPDLWAQGLTGAGVLIGHLDTGTDGAHPALNGAIAQFAEFDLLGNEVPGAQPHDTEDHGTHTAGTIAGRAAGGVRCGVAPGAQLASGLVIEGGNVIARVIAGMDWAVGLGIRVLSMSLGLPFPPTREDFLPLTQVLRARNVLPVFAVGNEGPGTSRIPGNYVEALSVGASNQNDAVAGFSSSEEFIRTQDPVVPDLVAPGVGVLSCAPGGGFVQLSGSSMATPHVAGLAALLIEADNTATVDQIEAAIFASCQLPPGMSPGRGNRGVPDGPRALAALTGTPPPPAPGGAGGAAAAAPTTPPGGASKAKAKAGKARKAGTRRSGGRTR